MKHDRSARPPARPMFKRGLPEQTPAPLPDAEKIRTARSGGVMRESKAMMKKEVAFMKKKGAPKSMIRHEQREMSDKMGRALKKKGAAGRAMKFSDGGSFRRTADGVATKGKTKGKVVKMRYGGSCG